MQVNWSGVYPATTTQFGLDQSLDIPATVQHAVNLVDAGVDGLVMLGTVGENCSLEMAEKLDVLRATMTAVQGRVPVLTGVAEYTTAAAINLANAARVEGIDGIMLLPGMVYRSDPRETMAHFRAVAADGGLPVMCYNNPPAYGVDITPEMFASLVDEPNLVAIKESSDDPRRITDIVNLCGDRYILFCGVDDLIVEAAALGISGWVAGLVNAFPEETVLLWRLVRQRKMEEAITLYRWFTPLLHLDVHVKLVQNIKLAQAMTGPGNEMVRAPRLPLTGEERDYVVDIIRTAIETRPNIDKAGDY
jgi:4-hydroxy-tetrahydrodipicolinate synthase